ncbi:alpha/beta fold hydrolase [Runella slithyformis]|uniref:Alpha/beta hydrolase fold protein n=1 Tax=Runella slithyformis (strain ATCC 29530 / DSM 19594 / LMG 11500 / NCIMB 11436 / LSU 4) TaxID=761193 RepID=A0A7U3ZQK8_RUNSL|nr:alpha/beta hydrolase [Runella slithyformis]AEI51565.1 alpha/beta hydrolase fold protein [Runella slithyformis DSM 19594]
MLRKLILWACICGLCGGLSSCFRSWRKNDRDIREHYANRTVKPTFYTIQNDSLKLFVATTGADTLPPLLLIHGAPGAWYGYLNMVDDSILQRKYHIISVDRLGYNHSIHRKKRIVTSIDLQARAAALALSLNHSRQKGVLLGRSYGAPIAAKIAILNPTRFHKLVMLAPAIDPAKEKFWWFSKPAKWWIVRLWLPHRINMASFEKFAHAKELEKLSAEWPLLQVPTTVVQGGKDWIVDPSNLDYARLKLAEKEAQFIFLPEAGHLITHSHPDLVRELVLTPFQRKALAPAANAAQGGSHEEHK